jgi:hypothetical protein
MCLVSFPVYGRWQKILGAWTRLKLIPISYTNAAICIFKQQESYL